MSATRRPRTSYPATPAPAQDPLTKTVMIVVGLALGVLMSLAKCSGDGHYDGGSGSSHRGGHYVNNSTDNHYRKR